LPAYRETVGKAVNRLFQMDYIERTNGFRDTSWLGVPIWQDVLDLWSLQEAISEIRPSLLIETGTFEGGSSLFYASLFDLIGDGEVITIDIEKQHDLTHPRVTYLVGDSSTAPDVVGQVTERARAVAGPVMVVLDSDHSEPHVLAEMEAYGRLVTPASKMLVQDGIIDTLGVPAYRRLRPGPLPAIKRFLAGHPEFVLDERNGRFPITFHPLGWLRRIPE
jgi:cephalosporin hydroxylase